MNKSEFYYALPEELIAQTPLEKRDTSRLLVLKKNTKEISHKKFADVADYMEKGDCLVVNDTKVIPARLYGKKENTGGKIEFVLLKNIKDDIWEVLVKPGKRAKPGSVFTFKDNLLKARVIKVSEGGSRHVEFVYDGIFNEVLDKAGIVPLPPYIHEELEDPKRYQTVYAKYKGSAAAPTAGLHFTDELLAKLKDKGIKIACITLHVGIGTFRPVKTEKIEDHKMHPEYFSIKQREADIINDTKKNNKKVIAVGTTSCRVLETVSDGRGFIKAKEGWTDIFIYPGYKFKNVDRLITNFHLPESTLIMLVSALAGREDVLYAYNCAVEEKYRFFSFGDAMLITD